MLTPPPDLSPDTLVTVLARDWSLDVGSLSYRAVGFGSHHWAVVDRAGARWFATVDDLETKRSTSSESLDTAYQRLRAALAAACALHDAGATFVVSPVRTSGGEPMARAAQRYALALYPHVDGQSFAWGEFASPAHRQAVLDMLVAVHAASPAVRRLAMPDGYVVPHRDELEASLDSPGATADCGPYAGPVAALLTEHAAPIRRLLDRYDRLVEQSRSQPSRAVFTHGEPHPGNTMLAADGWRLIDWDTALVAPPERDLCSLDPGDGSVLTAYRDATGVAPLPAVLELYRVRWDLADIAVEVSRFRRPHLGSRDDEAGWHILRTQALRAKKQGPPINVYEVPGPPLNARALARWPTTAWLPTEDDQARDPFWNGGATS